MQRLAQKTGGVSRPVGLVVYGQRGDRWWVGGGERGDSEGRRERPDILWHPG